MKRFLYLLPFLFILGFLLPDNTDAQERPPVPYIVEDICPFECCTYGEWTAESPITAYKKQRDTTQIQFNIDTGDTFHAETGNVVILEPGIVRANQAYELIKYVSIDNYEPLEEPIQATVPAGDTLYVLNYLGEGVYLTWYQGEIFQENGMAWRFGRRPETRAAGEVNATLIKKPKTEWWVRIMTDGGKKGWILMKNVRVSGNDGCSYNK